MELEHRVISNWKVVSPGPNPNLVTPTPSFFGDCRGRGIVARSFESTDDKRPHVDGAWCPGQIRQPGIVLSGVRDN